MIPLREITACDQCGVCCDHAPCLLGSYKDVRTLETVFPDARQHLQVESNGKNYRVRVSAKPCRYLNEDKSCQAQEVKPQGGREFKCWDARTTIQEYFWTANQLRKIGYD